MKRAMMEKLDRMIILKFPIKAKMKASIKVMLGVSTVTSTAGKLLGRKDCETVS